MDYDDDVGGGFSLDLPLPQLPVAPPLRPAFAPPPLPVPAAPMYVAPTSAAAPPVYTPALGAAPPLENGHTLGFALLATGLGGAFGAVYGGLMGGIAGGMFGGSLVNGFRAYREFVKGTPEGDTEATVSLTYSVIGAGIASYFLYKGRAKPNVTEHGEEDV